MEAGHQRGRGADQHHGGQDSQPVNGHGEQITQLWLQSVLSVSYSEQNKVLHVVLQSIAVLNLLKSFQIQGSLSK